jgi:hypothetical protein
LRTSCGSLSTFLKWISKQRNGVSYHSVYVEKAAGSEKLLENVFGKYDVFLL